MSRSGRNTLRTRVLHAEDGLMVKEIIYGRLNLGRGLLRRMKNGGGVYLNGKRDFITRRVKAGDLIEVEFFDEETSIYPQDLPLDIIFEDDYVLVVNKPAGMVVHPTGTYSEGTLVNGLAYRFKQQGVEAKIRLVHRLDKDTSGLIVVSKEPYTHQRLLQQLAHGGFKREYLAVVAGVPDPRQGLIDLPITHASDSGIKRSIGPKGKPARTQYSTVRTVGSYSLVRLTLETGRTHQIRVHMSSIGHPLLGDELYGGISTAIDRQALHSWRLEFTHPRTGLVVTLRCPLPADMFSLLGKEIDHL